MQNKQEHGRAWKFVRRPTKLHLDAGLRSATPKMRHTLCGLYVMQFYVRKDPKYILPAKACAKCIKGGN